MRSIGMHRDHVESAARIGYPLWCAKEPVLKALGDGLRRDPREAEVASAASDRRLIVDCAGRRFEALGWVTDGLIAVIAG